MAAAGGPQSFGQSVKAPKKKENRKKKKHADIKACAIVEEKRKELGAYVCDSTAFDSKLAGLSLETRELVRYEDGATYSGQWIVGT